MNEQIIDNILLYSLSTKEQKNNLILNLQKKRIELVQDYRKKKRRKTSVKRPKNREAPDRILPELRDIFNGMSDKCKQLMVR